MKVASTSGSDPIVYYANCFPSRAFVIDWTIEPATSGIAPKYEVRFDRRTLMWIFRRVE